MSEPVNGGNVVSFTVKELLARQDGKLDTIILTLAAKAERGDLDRLSGRVEALERGAASQQGSSGYARWVVPVLISIVAISMALATLLTR